jgi:hypothetical protein
MLLVVSISRVVTLWLMVEACRAARRQQTLVWWYRDALQCDTFLSPQKSIDWAAATGSGLRVAAYICCEAREDRCGRRVCTVAVLLLCCCSCFGVLPSAVRSGCELGASVCGSSMLGMSYHSTVKSGAQCVLGVSVWHCSLLSISSRSRAHASESAALFRLISRCADAACPA